MSILARLKGLPIDLGQKELRHTTQSSLIALSLAGEGRKRTALDAGCADGFWSEALKKQGWIVSSIDKKTNYPDALQHDMNAKLPFADMTFDMVFSTAVIAYLDDPKHFICEVKRVLKPDGRYVITTPNLAFWLNLPLIIFGSSLRKIADQNQKNFFDAAGIRQLFSRGQMFGYFPYWGVKMRITRLVGLLSPVFILHGMRSDL